MEPKWFTLKSYMCPECHKDNEVVRVDEGIDSANGLPFGLITLTCGHTHKLYRVSKELKLLWNTKVSVKPVTKEGIPVAVSGGTSTQIASFSGLQGFINNTGQFTVENLTLNNVTYNTSFTSTTYELHDILVQIDNSNHSADEKDKIKQIMKIVHSEIKSKPLPEILASLGSNLKTCLPIATPFIIPFLNKFLNG